MTNIRDPLEIAIRHEEDIRAETVDPASGGTRVTEFSGRYRTFSIRKDKSPSLVRCERH